ncbi:MAG: hypothetical protein GC131_05415 [Alphaproteobacteria bacterium]|nr:hypothetical protein [Alphaproteobacteria bacterium]
MIGPDTDFGLKTWPGPMQRGPHMRRTGSVFRTFCTAAAFASLTLLFLTPIKPAHATDFTASISTGGMNIMNDVPGVCASAVTVCGRQLNPVAAELGGGFTVKIDGHFRSSYECNMIEGRPAWVPVTVEGTCESVPVIMLPARYDEDEAWNVG